MIDFIQKPFQKFNLIMAALTITVSKFEVVSKNKCPAIISVKLTMLGLQFVHLLYITAKVTGNFIDCFHSNPKYKP